jgi:hypothetical protein
MSFLLKVKYIPATNFHGSRVSAKDQIEKLATTIPWDDELETQENFDNVVKEWIRRKNVPNLSMEFVGEYKGDKFYRIQTKE